jgi:hypothetical protein
MRPINNNPASNPSPNHEAVKLLNLLFSNCPDDTGNICLRYKHPKEEKAHNQFIGVNHIEQIPDIIKRRTNVNWSYEIALCKGYDATKDGIYLMPALHLDQDRLTQEKKREIHSFLKPSAVIQTSSENRQQFLWLLKEPAEAKDQVRVEDINLRLINQFGGDRGTQDASRVFRLPGTANFKYPNHPKCKILELNPECQYSLEDFEVLPKCETSVGTNKAPVDSERLQKIMQCVFLQHCDKDRAILPEPEWYAMVCLLAKETGGANLIHSLSVGYPKYSRDETDRKMIHAINDSGPTTCKRIKELYNCGKNCGVTSPVLLAGNSVLEKAQSILSYEALHLQSSLEISQLEVRVEWAVDKLIPKDGNSLLHSIGGVGKSYLMYQLGKSVADGEPFFGLATIKMPVYYIDFENPLPEIVDRMKKIGGSKYLKIWHLSHEPGPIRFDADEWEIYKTFPPGLFIIDSLRSSYLDEENSSKVASFIMALFKEIRSLGNTIILIHHENKIGSYRGSTAWFDLSDHILKFSRVKEIGSDKDVDDDNFDLPIRLGLGGKSRFSSALELRPMFFRFENQLLVSADNPDNEPLENVRNILIGMTGDGGNPPTQGELIKLIKKELEVGKDKARQLIRKGEGVYWRSYVNKSEKNKTTYRPIFCEG